MCCNVTLKVFGGFVMCKSQSDVQLCINIMKKRDHTVDSMKGHQLELICTSCLHLSEYQILLKHDSIGSIVFSYNVLLGVYFKNYLQ